MPYGAKKLLEMKAERERKKAEKARLKAEKEKQKKEEKKKERHKKAVQRKNAKQYAKRKQALKEYRKLMGDEEGTFSIYLMKDGKRIKFYGRRRLKNSALQLYHELLDKNKKEVAFQKTFVGNRDGIIKEHTYELVLVKKIDPTQEDNVTSLRNEDGKFIANQLVDAPSHKILDKNEWLIEETFDVYGYHPYKDRKDFHYIYNNIILKDTSIYSRLFVYKNKLIHHYDDDFDMITCKTTQQAIDLYDTIEKKLDHKKYPNVLFMGKTSGTTTNWIVDEIEKKTGWPRKKCLGI